MRCSAQHAFAVHTGRIGEWWHPSYSANAETFRTVTIEPEVGGRVFATHDDSGTHDWGEVTVWEPGRRLAHTFTLAQDPEAPSEVSADFVDVEGGCTLRLAHGGWTEANAADRAKFNDWPVLLDRFAELAEASGNAGLRTIDTRPDAPDRGTSSRPCHSSSWIVWS